MFGENKCCYEWICQTSQFPCKSSPWKLMKFECKYHISLCTVALYGTICLSFSLENIRLFTFIIQDRIWKEAKDLFFNFIFILSCKNSFQINIWQCLQFPDQNSLAKTCNKQCLPKLVQFQILIFNAGNTLWKYCHYSEEPQEGTSLNT